MNELLKKELSTKCLNHIKEPIWEEEVHRDLLPGEVQVYTSYHIYWCKKCKNREKALEEFNYWKSLCDQVGVSDLKYWELEYVKQADVFQLTVPNVNHDDLDRNDDSPTQWISRIKRSEMVGIIGDKEKFRELIISKLKELGERIKEVRKLEIY